MSFFFSSRRRHTRSKRDWSSDVCSSDLSSRYSPRTARCSRRVAATAWQARAPGAPSPPWRSRSDTGTSCWPTAWTPALWRRRPVSGAGGVAGGGSLEQIDAVERARAQVPVLRQRVRARAAALVRGLDIDRAAPVLGSFGGFERAVLPLRLPLLNVHFLARAVEILDLDLPVVIVESHSLEQHAAA